MYPSERAARGVLLLVIATACTVIALDGVAGVEYHDDQVMTGLVQDQRIDMWGNISVPEGGRLELRNVTVVFHIRTDQAFGIIGGSESTLVISDGDGDPGTRADASNITASDEPWSISIAGARYFEVSNSLLQRMGRVRLPPFLTYSRIVSNRSVVNASQLLDLHLALLFLGDSLYMNGTTIVSDEAFQPNSDTVELVDCDIRSSVMTVDVEERIRLVGCRIETGRLNMYDPFHFEAVSTDFIDTTVTMLGPDSTMRLSGCRFSSVFLMPLYVASGEVTIQGCSFDGKIQGLYLSTTTLDVSDCSISGFSYGLRVRSAVRLNITSVNVSHCGSAILVSRAVGVVRMERVWVSECPVGVGLDDYFPGDDIAGPMYVTDCRFNGTAVGLNCLNRDLYVSNFSFDPGVYRPTYGIILEERKHDSVRTVMLSDVHIANSTIGINISTMTIGHVNVSLERTSIRDCKVGLICMRMSLLVLDDVNVVGTGEGILINGTERTVIDHLELLNGTHGLSIRACRSLEVGDLRIVNLTGIAIEEVQISKARWNISRDTTISDARLVLVGSVHVTADLALVDTDLLLMGGHDPEDGLHVEQGAELVLVRSFLHGTWVQPFHLKVHDGSKLNAVEAEIAYCGRLSNDVSLTGPFLEGGSHVIRNVTVRDCQTGLVLKGCRATISGCQISANRTGLVATDTIIMLTRTNINGSNLALEWSNVTADLFGCILESSLIGVRITRGDVWMAESTLAAVVRTVELKDTELTLQLCKIVSLGEPFRVLRSQVSVWYSEFTPSRADGGTVDGGEVSLHDCSCQGDWNVVDALGKVERLWHFDVSAHMRWSGAPAAGFEVHAQAAVGEDGAVLLGSTDREGILGKIWLVEAIWTSTGRREMAPYTLTIATLELRAEAKVAATIWDEIDLEVIDVVSPVILAKGPTDGWAYNVTSISFTGMVFDWGSGMDALEFSFDDGFWESLDHDEEGSWGLVLETFDGPHVIRFMARDRDGNENLTMFRFTIDTVPPLVAFTSPEAMSPYGDVVVTLRGLVVDDEGTAIARCTVEDIEVELDEDGRFSLQLALGEEGENVFTAVVWDLAGNAGIATLILLKDTTPPVLVVTEVPRYTRETEVTVRGTINDLLETLVTVNGRFGASLANGTFEFDVTLVMGRNQLLFEAVDALGNKALSVHLVDVDNLINGTVLHPVEGQEVGTEGVLVQVITDPDTWVRVKDRTEWTHTMNGSLELWVPLEPGNATVLVVDFRDRANNTLERAVTVIPVEPGDEVEGTTWPWWALAAVVLVLTLAAVTLLGLRNRTRS